MADESEMKVDLVVEAMQVKFSILELRPNDVLVFSIPDQLRIEQIEDIKKRMNNYLKEQLGIPNKLIVICGGAQFGVIRQL